MLLHPWWSSFGEEVAERSDLKPALARELASLAAGGELFGTSLIALRQSSEMGCAAVALDVDVERPQDLAHPVQAVEPIAVVFPFTDGQPSILSLRSDFPDTPHQNWSPPDGPCSLCIDDRPWAEAQLTTSSHEIARRIQIWLAKAARGELHDPAQPPDPLFFASPFGLILPVEALADTKEPVQLVGMMRPDNQRLIISAQVIAADSRQPAFSVLAYQAQPQAMARLRHAPDTLLALAAELQPRGIGLIDDLKARLRSWAGLGADHIRRLSVPLVIVVKFPVRLGERPGINDIRAFLTQETAGNVGVALGVLQPNNSDVGDRRGYMPMLAGLEATPSEKSLFVDPLQVHFALNRELAAMVAGRDKSDRRRVVLIGAGSLGSQLSIDLAREGAFGWTVVDEDHLLPHNFVRHALFAAEIGAPKAGALAHKLSGLLGEPAAAIHCDVIRPGSEAAPQLAAAFKEADIIIDAAASVAVSRHLSDLQETPARRVSAFYNPAGTAVVLLAESVDRDLTLCDLEAQYHRLILTEPSLAGHLGTDGLGVRYTGSCRSLTNRISSSNAAILSALAANGIVSALENTEATITIWTLSSTGEVRRVQHKGAQVTSFTVGAWAVSYDSGVLDRLNTMRRANLPAETGGILLGIVDMSRKSIHIAHALPAPEDSSGSETSFERGVVNLAEHLGAALAATMHQLRYVGEWHSHPDRSSSLPSVTDVNQLSWLGQELKEEGLPGLMAIAAQDGYFTFAVTGTGVANDGGAT